MTVFLLILKILGITLLVIIGIILLLVLMILYIPVRYKVSAQIPENDIKSSNGSAYIRYLHLIRIWLSYGQTGFEYRLKVLCFKINLNKDVKESADEHTEVPVTESEPAAPVIREVKTKKEYVKNKENNDNNVNTNNLIDKESLKNKHKTKKKKAKTGKKDKHDFKKLWNEIKFYYKMLKDEGNKDAFRHCMKRLKKLLKHYMPRKAKGYVTYGLTDPANTGLITGFLSIFPFMYTGEFTVNPDFNFDRNYVCGDLLIKGHIRAVHLLNMLISVYFNKDVKRFIKLMKRHKLKEE